MCLFLWRDAFFISHCRGSKERGKKKKKLRTALLMVNLTTDKCSSHRALFVALWSYPLFFFSHISTNDLFFFSAACGRVSVKESGQERAEEVLSKRKERKSQFHVLWLESSPYVIPLLFNSHLQFSITLVYWLFTLEKKAKKKKSKRKCKATSAFVFSSEPCLHCPVLRVAARLVLCVIGGLGVLGSNPVRKHTHNVEDFGVAGVTALNNKKKRWLSENV